MDKLFPDNDRSPELVGNPVFPAEVTDMIIDYLHNCPYMLKRCSLVCRDWTASSRYHLFYTISFSSERAAFSDVLAFIVSAPDIHPYIKAITLSDYRGISLKDVRAVLEPLTSLNSVTLDRLHISKPHWREPVLEPALHALATLRISSCNVVEIDTSLLLRLLGLFSEITTLHLAHAMSSYSMRFHDFGSSLNKFPLHLRVSNLELRPLPIQVLDMLFHRDYLPHRWASLHTLCIDGGCRSWEHVRKIGEFLAVVGPQLREIALRLTDKLVAPREDLQAANGQPPAAATTKKWRALRLDKCTKLEVFKISVGHVDYFARRDSKTVFRATVDLLTHLPSTVKQVRIGFSPDRFSLPDNRFEQYKDFLMGLDWQALDNTMAAPKFKTLTVVLDVGLVRERFNVEQCQELLKCATHALPGLDSREMLKFDFTERKWWVLAVQQLWD
ncbi:hypothetical protein K466DRAFT_565502 [Polyporus arcularius HHB13444]|uniref:F-box domain-containing protein n=1 Tax=Polyporus arcularius HHB13444 TaxID=1314778 RepID=A0A5C3PEA4_9APHY|nr:hypothetical protein K466DRAFT_565502 [Polyporus arcularius HHB13444]